MRNSKTLQEIVKGQYGRKIAYTNFEVIDETNVCKVLSDTIGIFHRNREVARYLWDYKNGDQPILYRTKTLRSDVNNPVVENHAWEFVQFGVSQTYGEPLQYVSLKKDDSVNERVEKFNSIMARLGKAEKNISQGEWKGTAGTSFLSLRQKSRDKRPFVITTPTPLNAYVVYSALDGEPALGVQEVRTADRQNEYYCWTDTHTYIVRNGKLKPIGENGELKRLHAFGMIPIIEVPNNQSRISDIELVISMLDAINNMQSNRMDAVQQFVQSWIKFINCEIDYDDLVEIRKNGAIVVPPSDKGSQADVDFINQELNQSESQVAKDDLLSNAESILAIPNKEGNTGGDSQGAVELRNGWDFSKGRARLKDAYVTGAEMRFAQLALKALSLSGIDLGLTDEDFEVHINHSPTDNLIVKAQALEYLLKNGIHPLVAIKACGIWGDAEKVYLMSKPYLDALYVQAREDGVNLDEQEKKVSVFMQSLNAGLSPEESAKLAGIEENAVKNSPTITNKWNYE